MSTSDGNVESLTGELRQKLSAVTNRLRLIQIELGDETPETRREYITEEVKRALAGVPREHQEAFLANLKAMFPTWDPNVVVAPPRAAQGPTPTDLREMNDPSFLVGRLTELAKSLSDDQKETISRRLRDAGLAAGDSGAGISPKIAELLRQRLNVPEGKGLSGDRILELTMLLAEFVCTLDQVVWPTWRQMNRRGSAKRPVELKQTIGRHAGGDPEVPSGQIISDLEKLRKLIVAMISGVGRVGHQFAEQHLARFDPSEISSLVKLEGKGFLVSHEIKCWRKYEELAKSLNGEFIQDEMMKIMVDLVQRLSQGITA